MQPKLTLKDAKRIVRGTVVSAVARRVLESATSYRDRLLRCKLAF
jgi:hypothetical protein